MVYIVTNKPYSNIRVCMDIAEALNGKCLIGRYNPYMVRGSVIINGTLDGYFPFLAKHHRHNKQIWYPVIEGFIWNEYLLGKIKRLYWNIQPYVITPSRYVKEKLEYMGIPVDDIIPHGVRFKPYIGNKDRKYLFLYISGYLERKFPPYSEPVLRQFGKSLTLVTSMNNPYKHYAGRVLRIIYDNGNLSDNDILMLYRSHRFYLNLSDSEGFGLTPLEALSQGCLPIVLDTPPFNEYCSNEYCYMVKPSEHIWFEQFGDLLIEHHSYDPNEYISIVYYALNDKHYYKKQRLGIRYAEEMSIYNVYKKFNEYL
jgi:hypothetical protein